MIIKGENACSACINPVKGFIAKDWILLGHEKRTGTGSKFRNRNVSFLSLPTTHSLKLISLSYPTLGPSAVTSAV